MTEAPGPTPLTITRRTHDDTLIVDLTEVTYLSSAGLTALLTATQEAERRHETLRLVVDSNRPVVRAIMITDSATCSACTTQLTTPST